MEISLPDSLKAPVKAGQKVGEIQWKLENEVLKTVEINAAGSAEALSWLICLRELVQRFCCFS